MASISNVFLPGTVLNGRYEIERVLSQKGGMGLLYLARDRQTHHLVAIKRNKETSADARAQFELEARMLQQLSRQPHPNLVRVEGYFVDAHGAQFLVMEYIPGDDLEDLMKQRNGAPFETHRVIEWGKMLCGALAHLHKQNPPIIHRDLKPGNVRLKPGDQVVLVDFGIAKMLRPGQQTIRGARGYGSPGYAPVEQYGGGTDQRTDLYALGAVLYHLLTQRTPEEAAARLNHPQLDLAGVEPRIAPVLIKAMEVKSADRYQSADEMLSALQNLQPAFVAATKSCAHCGNLNRDNAVFCFNCGTRFVQASAPAMCPRCAVALRAHARFCHACGLRLMPVSTPAPAPIVCPSCNTPNRARAKFCSKCRHPFMPSRIAPPAPPRPSPIPPTAPGVCPNCAHANLPGEFFCERCGSQLPTGPAAPPISPAPPTPAPMPSPQPSPAPVAPLPEQQQVGWILFAVGVLAVLCAVWFTYATWLIFATIPLAILGVITAIAGRDLLGLFDAHRPRASSWLAFAFGDERRGRVWGAITATLWLVVGAATAWLVLPLAILGAMIFALNVLVSERFAQSLHVHSTRPGWVIVIGWLLVFSGIGTIPGIALLIPKGWAKGAASVALIALGFAGAFGVMVSFAGASIAPNSLPLDWTVPGTNLSVFVASGMTASIALFAGVVAALRYLNNPQVQLVTSSATAHRRELNVAAWTLLGVGVVTIFASFVWLLALPWLIVFWVGLAISVCAIIGARDLLELGNARLGASVLVGSMARGRRLGIIASSALAVVCIALAWLGWTLALLVAALYLLFELMSVRSINECGERCDAPPGVTLIAWMLVPTGIGTYPGIQMLRGEKLGWQWARPALGALMLAGLGLALWALSSAAMAFPVTPLLVACGIAMFIAYAGGLVYVDQPVVRRHFGV